MVGKQGSSPVFASSLEDAARVGRPMDRVDVGDRMDQMDLPTLYI